MYNVIKGSFHIEGYSPDGDSIRFKAESDSDWDRVKGKVKLNDNNHVQLRINSIDAPEMHFKKIGQPEEFVFDSVNLIFKELGIKNVKWKNNIVSSADDGKEGFIITNSIDNFGRPKAFLFSENINFKSENVDLNADILKNSINFKLLQKGYVYPYFDDEIFQELVMIFSNEVKIARNEKKGLWVSDYSNKFMNILTIEDLSKKYIMAPFLFKRIVLYFQKYKKFNADNFIEFVEGSNDKVLRLDTKKFVKLSEIIDKNDSDDIKLKVHPEDIVFMS